MKRFATFAIPMLAMTLVLSLAHFVRADDATAATGTVTVTVTDPSDKPVEGANVRVSVSMHGQKKADQAQAQAADGGAPTTRPAPIAEGKTDKDGKVTLEKVPAGDYNCSANLRGTGNARQKISVKAGENVDVALKLAPRQK
jgi:hypothetical protein